ICNEGNLREVNKVLQKVQINKPGDYRESEKFVNKDTFVYFDPPYRPISNSSSFTSYSKFDFGDKEQKELALYLKDLNKVNAKLMLSNSDPRNVNPGDDFFETEETYGQEDIFHIIRVQARRSINSKSSDRGKINELLITNYCTDN
ncbi:DNA adenine methylase, partial [Neobacillus drentensis]|uniref:DNA adenine methylase n=1 Tax=Neobacillus drentensis TaxID=220684 RepID=UPI003001DE59